MSSSNILEFINISSPSIGGIGYLVKLIVGISSSIALGVFLFTIILKLITLPFDFISRRSMRKNSLLMEKMRPELEKLQKQYAGDKMLYNQKMQALYKKNGYSMAGACLPTIITLVVFIIAINGFTTFANYQNKQYFYDMSVSYNQAFYDGLLYNENPDELEYGEYIIVKDNDEGEITSFDLDEAILQLDSYKNAADDVETPIPNSDFKFKKETQIVPDEEGNPKEIKYVKIYTDQSYIEVRYLVDEEKGTLSVESLEVNLDRLDTKTIGDKTYNKADYEREDPKEEKEAQKQAAIELINEVAAKNSAERFRSTKKSFLWVKNIWVTDSTTAHPINSNYNKFLSSHKVSSNEISAGSYQNLISQLQKETKEPNGYFILVALTAISSLLMQLIMSKSQKAQMELQTVDGQGAKSNKLMTWIMPIMMAVFAFTMTAAFSIYMITSSIFSIFTTLLINKLVDKSLKKKMAEETEVSEGKEVIRGRVFTKEPPKPEPKKKKKKKEEERVDFLNEKKENKKIRGRLK